RLAYKNTQKNLETCGFLAGTLRANALFVSSLIVPSQTATSDTCEMLPEGEVGLWEYCDAHDLLTLGWIHTHPTQTCFMSSRDLHTHSGYQAQLAESVAVVCAPRHEPSSGVFRLTDPPGLKHILGCTKTGIFHPHEVSNLYTDALKPGHVCELPGLEFEVVDLRR
ncbi:MAG: Mov34/MPN/PAD-1 family protein, partial [Terriglobus roseus]|nr:Mov34/MPN/PAD-1 family protein [Terriglobus roseus]